MSDAEKALLGCVLSGYSDIPLLSRQVTAVDFDEPRHGEIWMAVVGLHHDGQPIDKLTVRQSLVTTNPWWLRGAEMLFDLDVPGVVATAPHYAELVREEAISREIYSQGMRMQQLAQDPGLTSTERLARAREWIAELDQRQAPHTTTQAEAFERLMDSTQRGVPYLPTPWAGLNNIIHGMRRGQLWIVGARPSVGKTIFAENYATHVGVMTGQPVLFVTLEMSAEEITARTMAHLAGVRLDRILNGDLSEADEQRLAVAQPRLYESRLTICDRSSLSAEEIRSEAWIARQAARQTGSDLALVVIDYVGLIDTSHRESRAIELGQVSRSLKILARELQVPVCLMSQLNRAITMKTMEARPTMADLRESGSLEQDADGVILLHAKQDRDPRDDSIFYTGEIEMIVDKNRNGRCATTSVTRSGEYARLTGS